MSQPHVVLVGGGFAGLYAARALRHAPARVTLVDRRNHHLFQPLLYQVATAGLTGPDIAAPLRKVLGGQANTTVLLAEAVAIDTAARRLTLSDGALDYDFLMVATGATHQYFGHDEWAAHAPGLKTLADALDIRRRILLAYEAAEREGDAERLRALLTFVVVGGGPTGVELAGALAEIARHTLARDFRHFDAKSARVLLLEGLERILPTYPPSLSESALRQLQRLGVDVRVSTKVTAIDAEGVSIGKERLPARTVLWAAGVACSPLARSLNVPLDRAGRVLVNDDLSVPGHLEIFVTGDLAAVKQGEGLVPGVAPAAIQMGKHAASNILRIIAGRPALPFRYNDRGSLATIGRSAAVGVIGKLHLSGFIAWVAWLAIHVFFLIGFRNRFVVIFEWAWAYLTYQRSARILVEEYRAAAPPSDAGERDQFVPKSRSG